jgi:hypothetical protein
MNRLMIIARLAEGAHDEAEELLRKGPPFDPEALGLHRHAAYLTADEVVFIFEAPDVEWTVNDLLDDLTLAPAVVRWDKLVEGIPRIAHECFYWSRETNKLGVGLGT